MQSAFAPTEQRIREKLQKPDGKFLRRVQWTYFFVSILALLGLLAYIDSEADWNLAANGLMAVIYLAVLGLLLRLFVRPEKVRLLMHHFSPLVKVTLLFNYLALVLLLEVAIGVWWKKASILAGVFVATVVAIWLLGRILWPVTEDVNNWFAGPPPPRPFDPGDPQGRTVRNDQT